MEASGWEGKREVKAVVVVEAVEETMEKEPMGMRTKSNWRKTILEPDDESGLKQMLESLLRLVPQLLQLSFLWFDFHMWNLKPPLNVPSAKEVGNLP